MTTSGWIILLVLLVPAIGILLWVILGESFIRVPSGRLALVLVRGKPTDTVLGPGVHFVPALRRRTVEVYPSVEMSFRAGGAAQPADQPTLDSHGPAVEVFLGDRTRVLIGYTVRFRLLPSKLRVAHERFGPTGLLTVVRDQSAAVLTAALGHDDVTVDDLFGDAREQRQELLSEELGAALAEDGFELTALSLRTLDLGRTGDAIQGVARARHELAQENAAATVRRAGASNDAELQRLQRGEGTGGPAADAAWRYRETELWRELILRRETLNVTLPAGTRLTDPSRPTDPSQLPADPVPPDPEIR